MNSMILNEIDFKQINEGPVIYQIRNLITGRVFIASTMNFKKHLKGLLSNLENAQRRNPELLNKDYQAYGSNTFVIEILKDSRLTKENINIFKEKFIKSAKRLYNVKRDLTGGGYETLSEPCYILELNGTIKEAFPSIQSAFKFLNITPHYSGKNSPSIIDGKYRIVTQEFYKYHKIEILRWPNYSDLTKYMSEVYKKASILSIEEDGEKKLFKNVGELSEYIHKTKEAIRLVLKGETLSNPLNITYAHPDAREEFNKLKVLKETERVRKRQERKLRKMAI